MNLVILFFILIITFVDSGHIFNDPVKHLECILQIRTGLDCPVDGGWTQWGEWEDCQGQCGQVGHHVRRRLCTNPTPGNGGYDCRGQHQEIQSCQLSGCVPADYEKLIRGDPLRSAQYELIKAVHERFPALAMKCLENTCRYETVKNVLHSGASDYWTSLHCVKHNVGCPVRGGWTPWNSWSHCSAICGHGKRYRQRSCANPRPTAVDLDCEGVRLEHESCSGTACAEHMDGEWFVWSLWSDCSESCGPGIRKRDRKCQGQRSKREANYGHDRLNRTLRQVAKHMVQAVDAENRCSGPTWEVEKCANKDCDWNGGWSAWEDWTPCSLSCDLGFQTRSRSCSSPPIRGNGVQCAGETTETRRCYMQPCLVKPHLLSVFNGDSQLVYPPTGQPKTLLHIYIRFLPLQPHAKLIDRHIPGCVKSGCDKATLSIEGGYVVWQATAQGCKATAYSEEKLEINKWHELLLTITGLKVTVRIDDSILPLVGYFNCVPTNPNFDHEMTVGEFFHGHIELMNVNFRPLYFRQNPKQQYHETGCVPSTSFNMHYGTSESEIEEGFRHFADNELIAASCPQNSDHWKVELAVKVESINGLLLLLPTEDDDHYTDVVLELGRIKLREHNGDLHSEVASNRQFVAGDWIHVVVSRGGVLRDGNFSDSPCDVGMSVNGDDRIALASTASKKDEENIACSGQLFVGSAPLSHQIDSEESIIPLSGFLGFLAIDGVSTDVEALPSAGKSGQVLSSHTISSADHYIEKPMSLGQQINLSCYYEHTVPTSNNHNPTATWLFFDTVIDGEGPQSKDSVDYNVKDNGMVAQLTIPAYPSRESIEGFYLCWVEKDGVESKVLIAFGVTISVPGGVLGTTLYLCGLLAVISTITFQLVRLYIQCRRKSLMQACEKDHNPERQTESNMNKDPEKKIKSKKNLTYTTLRMETLVDHWTALPNSGIKEVLSENETSATQYDSQSHGDGAHNREVRNARRQMPQSQFAQHCTLSERQTQDEKEEEIPRKDNSVYTARTSSQSPSKTCTSDSSLQPSLPPIPTEHSVACLVSVAEDKEIPSETDGTGHIPGNGSAISASEMSTMISDADEFVELQQRTTSGLAHSGGLSPLTDGHASETQHWEQISHGHFQPTSPREFVSQHCEQVYDRQFQSPSPTNRPKLESRHSEQSRNQVPSNRKPIFDSRRSEQMYNGQRNQIRPNNITTYDSRHSEQVYEGKRTVQAAFDSRAGGQECHPKPGVSNMKDKFDSRHSDKECQVSCQPKQSFTRPMNESTCSEGEFQGHSLLPANRPKLKSRFTHQQPAQHESRGYTEPATSAYFPQSYCDCPEYQPSHRTHHRSRAEANPLVEFNRLAQVDDDRNAEIFGTYKMPTPHSNMDRHSRSMSEHFMDLDAAARDAQYDRSEYCRSKYELH